MKNKFGKQLGILAISALAILGISQNCEAAGNYEADGQIGQTQTSITISLDQFAQDDEIYYADYMDVYVSEDALNVESARPIRVSAKQTSYTISGLKPGTVYTYFLRRPYTYVDTDDYGNPLPNNEMYDQVQDSYEETIVTLPGKLSGVCQGRWYRYDKSVDVKWDTCTGVTGYEYEFKDDKNKVIATGQMSGWDEWVNSYADAGFYVSNSKIYTCKVRAYTTINGSTYRGEWSNVAYLFTQPKVSKATISSDKLVLKWNAISGATGYDVYVSTKKNSGYKKVKSLSKSKTSLTVKKLSGKKFSKKKTYYVYIAAKKKVGSVTYNSGCNYISPVKRGKLGSETYIK